MDYHKNALKVDYHEKTLKVNYDKRTRCHGKQGPRYHNSQRPKLYIKGKRQGPRRCNLVHKFHQAMHKGLECGNRIFGMFGVANCFAVAINLGENLGSLKRTMRSTYRQSCETSLDAMSLWAQPAMQFVLNLQSYITDWGELTSLTGEIMKEEVYLQQVNEAKPQRTAEALRDSPTPTIAPVMVCVVEIGMPK